MAVLWTRKSRKERIRSAINQISFSGVRLPISAFRPPLLHVLAQLDVPVGEVNKVLPTVVVMQAEVDLDERPPLGPFGLADKMQAGLLGRAVGLLRVAFDAGADDVFPRRRAAAVARDDVIQVQILAVEDAAAVLAGVFVALKNV